MPKYLRGEDREELLADVAEWYYEKGLTQQEISQRIGSTRSAISRMLAEARQKGIVEIQIHRLAEYEPELERALAERFQLKKARVLAWGKANEQEAIQARLGLAAAQILEELIAPDDIIGLAWGMTVTSTIQAFKIKNSTRVKVVQLVGVLGAQELAYNSYALVHNLAQRLGGEPVYLHTPFIVENSDTARALLNNQSIRDAIELGKRCNIALFGIGSTDPRVSSLYAGGYISSKEIETLGKSGAVGDVCGHHFDLAGKAPEIEFHHRLVGIARDDLLRIPVRLGVAGGSLKAKAIIGALRGKYVNMLITDSSTARLILQLANEK